MLTNSKYYCILSGMTLSVYTQTGYHGTIEPDGRGVLHGLTPEQERDAREVARAAAFVPKDMSANIRRGNVVVVSEQREDNFA